MELIERLSAPGPKRILALDGGGIRGCLSLGFLGHIEELLRRRHGDERLVLADYFDLIGGTSTGAIIAAGLAIGLSTEDLKELYLDLGGEVFGKKKWKRWESIFSAKPLDQQLRRILGDRTLGDPEVRTGLCVVTKRADTGSTWPLINHPGGRYYRKNRDVLLRQAVRASAAAPVAFVPEKLEVGDGEVGAFVDGGVSMANNPALQLFLIATLKGFPFGWTSRADELLVCSVGTGGWSYSADVDSVLKSNLIESALRSVSMLMGDATTQNQLLLQMFSRSPTRISIDREVGDLADESIVQEPLLHYLRYNVELEETALTEAGHTEFAPSAEALRDMAAAGNRHQLLALGEEAGAVQVLDDHFPASFDLEGNADVRRRISSVAIDDDRVRWISETADPAERNYGITLFYHDVAVALTRIMGGGDATWFGFGTWASETAGTFIRGESLPEWVVEISEGKHRAVPGPLRDAVSEFVGGLRDSMVQGNTMVFDELAPVSVRFLELLQLGGDEGALEALLETLREGPSDSGGQSLVRTALEAWFNAAGADDPGERAQYVLLGNCAAVYHEQQRLQPLLEEAMSLPLVDAVARQPRGSLLTDPIHGALSTVGRGLGFTRAGWRRFSTRMLMHYELPSNSVRVGRDAPGFAAERAFPRELTEISVPELQQLWNELAGDTRGTGGSAARNWSRLNSRMRFIATLFRSRQQDQALLSLPFPPRDAERIRSGRATTD
jgi:predicted acylesterase/phospholipase RssA